MSESFLPYSNPHTRLLIQSILTSLCLIDEFQIIEIHQNGQHTLCIDSSNNNNNNNNCLKSNIQKVQWTIIVLSHVWQSYRGVIPDAEILGHSFNQLGAFPLALSCRMLNELFYVLYLRGRSIGGGDGCFVAAMVQELHT